MVTLFLAFAGGMAARAQSTGPAKAAQSSPACAINTATPSEGDSALARGDFEAGELYFRTMLAKDPSSQEAALGHVRSLIGLDRVDKAVAEADSNLKSHPHSAIAEVAVAEAGYRAADFASAAEHAKLAAKDDPCEGRALAIYARLSALNAFFAQQVRLLAVAHRLRPNDEIILRNWIETLPAHEQAVQLESYLGATHSLSPADRAMYTELEDHLQAQHPGECHIASRVENTRIPFHPFILGPGRSYYALDVAFNGKARRMQIDTGASGILLTPAAAKRLGLVPESRLRTGGVGDGGEVDSYLTHVASINIGGVEFSNCLVEVLERYHGGGDGLIGIDVFSPWLVTLDYPRAELRLAPLPTPPGTAAVAQSPSSQPAPPGGETPPMDAYVAPQMADWLRVLRIGHELFLPGRVNKGPTHYLMADTGAGDTSFSVALGKEAGIANSNADILVRGLSGYVNRVSVTGPVSLQFGTLSLPRSSYMAFDITNISHNSGIEVSGFVGLPTLSRLSISIDYRDNLMKLEYDPKHDFHVF